MSRNILLACVVLAALVCVVLYGLWAMLPHFCGRYDSMLASQTPVCEYRDRSGKPLLLVPTFDYQYRIDVPLSRVSNHVQRVMLAVEDRHFLHHDGVDRMAALRALWANIRYGRVVSGASTVTMQLAGMALPRRRSIVRKMLQAGYARNLEWRHGKEWIFANYLNRIPFGGKIHGIEAAGRHYFGCPAARLNPAEATLLCGLPQRPNAFRPDVHRAQARCRQRMVLWMLVQNGVYSWNDALDIYCKEPLRFRNFTIPSPLKLARLERADHYLQLASRQSDDARQVRCALDMGLQQMLLETLRTRVGYLAQVRDGAGVIIENHTGEVLAMVGTLDYHAPGDGQVNAATSRRTAGSALKPFIYAEAIDGGLVCADTVMSDRPLRYGTYAPDNYDGTFAGHVTAADALSRSLNTPAVRLVAQLGPARVAGVLGKLQLHDFSSGHLDQEELARKTGVSIALGTGGYTLVGLAAAYGAIARGGLFIPPLFVHGETNDTAQRRIFTHGTCNMVTAMLSRRPLPGCELVAAWKTGTSSGNRDAWCFAYTPEYTVGIWMGNKDGRGAPALVGAETAAPCAGAVLHALYRDGAPGNFTEDGLEQRELCAVSGLRARIGVCPVRMGTAVEDIPLRICMACGLETPGRVNILKPRPGKYIAKANGRVTVTLQADASSLHWYLDDVYLGQFNQTTRVELEKGHHCIRAVSEADDVEPGTVELDVQ